MKICHQDSLQTRILRVVPSPWDQHQDRTCKSKESIRGSPKLTLNSSQGSITHSIRCRHLWLKITYCRSRVEKQSCELSSCWLTKRWNREMPETTNCINNAGNRQALLVHTFSYCTNKQICVSSRFAAMARPPWAPSVTSRSASATPWRRRRAVDSCRTCDARLGVEVLGDFGCFIADGYWIVVNN